MQFYCSQKIQPLKYYSFFILFACTISFSCNRPKPFEIIVGDPIIAGNAAPIKPILPKMKFSFTSLDLYQDINSINHNHFKKYGTFYTRDFTIYQVKNLDLLEDNLYISEIYLYYVDKSLHKIQAFTTKNMSDFFLSKYGGAKLILKDRFNKNLAMTEGAVQQISGKTQMNKNLNNYKLKWKSADRLIYYQVNESAQKNFEALEELIDIENQQKIEIEPKYIFTIQSSKYNLLLARIQRDEIFSKNNRIHIDSSN